MKWQDCTGAGGSAIQASRPGRETDFSGEGRVKNVLRMSLLDREERRSRRSPLVWVLPAAAVLAAALLLI